MIEKQLKKIKNQILEYEILVEDMIRDSIKVQESSDKKIADNILHNLEKQANDKELEISEFCIITIARFAPKAKELRFILMVIQVISSLERIADHAVSITKSNEYLADKPKLESATDDINLMAKYSIEMLRDSVNAFINEKTNLARATIIKDNKIDDLQHKIFKEMVVEMKDDQKAVKRGMYINRISQNLERIADISTNICENTLFVTEAIVDGFDYEAEDNKRYFGD